VRRVELEPHEEHEQEKPDLGKRIDEPEARRRKERGRHGRRESAKHGWAEEQPGPHLSNHARLTQAAEYAACEPGRSNNDNNLEREQAEVERRIAAGRARRDEGARGGRQSFTDP